MDVEEDLISGKVNTTITATEWVQLRIGIVRQVSHRWMVHGKLRHLIHLCVRVRGKEYSKRMNYYKTMF